MLIEKGFALTSKKPKIINEQIGIASTNGKRKFVNALSIFTFWLENAKIAIKLKITKNILTGCKRTSNKLKSEIAVRFPSFLFFKTLSERKTIKLDIKNSKFTEFKLWPKEINIPLIAQIVPANKPILEFSFDEI